MIVDADVIIVGAGPSGCSAAYDLKSFGISVLLLDKTAFPRLKPCGGGLTIKTLQALRYSVKPVIKQVCYDMVLSKGANKKVHYKSKHPVCAMSVRTDFDMYCLNKTLQHGVPFKIINTIKRIQEFNEHVELETTDGVLKAKFIIGADGANSMVRKLSGLFCNVKKGLAIEADVALESNIMPPMEFDFNIVKFGYGWVFPKGDHVNVGLYTYNTAHKLTKKDVEEYASSKLGRFTLKKTVGHYMGQNGLQYSQSSSRIFLVGDAAGLVDPLLGEGIYNAVKSGQLAASAIHLQLTGKGSAKSIYGKEMKAVKRDLKTCRDAAYVFYKFPLVGYTFLTLKSAESFLMNGFAAGNTLNGMKKNLFKFSKENIVRVQSLY